MALPSLQIPPFPQEGQPFAFADREEQVRELYSTLVNAGNALIAGLQPAPARVVVTGYKGVGKSSVVVQVLQMLRDPAGIAPGQQVAYSGLADPVEPQRWLILRVSGKHVRGIEGLPDDLHRSVLAILDSATHAAEAASANVLRLSFFHRLFPTRERELFEKVRTALVAFQLTVDFVRTWRGARMTEKVESVQRIDRSAEIKVFLDSQLKLKGIKPESAEGQAAAGLSASFIAKWSQVLDSKRSIDHELTVNADLATEALNGLFTATAAARIPTVFVIDDFDELASAAGPSQAQRAKALMEVLGVFNQLVPTCLVIAVRQEYRHEDLFRQFRRVYLPPMTRAAGGEMLDKWAGIPTVQWSDEMRAALRAMGERFVGSFSEDAPVVLPDRFLDLVTWAANRERAGESVKDMLARYLRLRYDGETVRAALRLSLMLTAADLEACAETAPIDPTPYTISPSDRLALDSEGLLRPASAWNDADTRVIVDPLIAYLRAAQG